MKKTQRGPWSDEAKKQLELLDTASRSGKANREAEIRMRMHILWHMRQRYGDVIFSTSSLELVSVYKAREPYYKPGKPMTNGKGDINRRTEITEQWRKMMDDPERKRRLAEENSRPRKRSKRRQSP